jgi:hypothetical protein
MKKQNSGVKGRENGYSCLSVVMPAKAGIQHTAAYRVH